MDRLGEVLHGGHSAQHADRRELLGALAHERVLSQENLVRGLDRVQHERQPDVRPDRVEAVRERRDDAEVAAAAADRPEQVCIVAVAFAGSADRPVGGDDLGGDEIVDGEPVLPAQPTEAARERQAGDTRLADDADRRRETVLLRGAVEVAERGAPAHRRESRARDRSRPTASGRGRARSPPSIVPKPATLCPPPRTARGSPCSRAKRTIAWTSAVLVQRATSAGRASMMPFQTARASSYD